MNEETKKPLGMWHDAITGETIVRELTDEEIEQLPKAEEITAETEPFIE